MREFERWKQQTLRRVEDKLSPRKPWPRPGQRGGLYCAPQDTQPASLGFPGQPPFTRGVQPNMYRGRLWTMRQYAGFGTAAESNRRFIHLLQQGQTGISVAFDLPTQMGRDSDHAKALGEVGRVGVAIDCLDDMAVLLRDIPLERVSTSMTINATAAILLAMYVVVAERRGIDSHLLRGTIQNDILKEYVARGTYIYPPIPSLRLTRDILAWSSHHLPLWNPISVSGYHMREAGCTAAQELAFTLANAIAYLEVAAEAQVDLTELAKRVSFFFNAHNDLIEEVAKFRAARRMWDRICQQRFEISDFRARALRFHAQTAGVSLQAHQPLVNTARVTIQALSAVLGGCQSLHTNAFDEALALPTSESATLALRTQQVIAFESGVADFVDPLGGSFAIEAETDRLEQQALDYIRKIGELGGMVAAIDQGYVQKEIQNSAYEEQLAVENQQSVIVGVNRFTEEQHAPVPLQQIDPEIEPRQVAKIRHYRASRHKPDKHLQAVRDAAQGTDNIMLAIVEAVRAEATLGEISDALRDVFGEHRQSVDL